MKKCLLIAGLILVGCEQTPPVPQPQQNNEQTQSIPLPAQNAQIPQNAQNAPYYAPPVSQGPSALDTMANSAIAGASAGAAGALAHNMVNRAFSPKQSPQTVVRVYRPPVYRPAPRPAYRSAPRTQSIFRGRR